MAEEQTSVSTAEINTEIVFYDALGAEVGRASRPKPVHDPVWQASRDREAMQEFKAAHPQTASARFAPAPGGLTTEYILDLDGNSINKEWAVRVNKLGRLLVKCGIELDDAAQQPGSGKRKSSEPLHLQMRSMVSTLHTAESDELEAAREALTRLLPRPGFTGPLTGREVGIAQRLVTILKEITPAFPHQTKIQPWD